MDFSKMFFKVTPKTAIKKDCPTVLEYQEFRAVSEEALRFIFLFYDRNSPFVSEYKNFEDRKARVLRECDLPEARKKKIKSNEDEKVNKAIMRFFRLQNDTEWMMICSGMEAIFLLLEEARSPVDEELQDDKARNAFKAKKECFQDASEIYKEIVQMEDKIGMGAFKIKEIASEDDFKVGAAEKFAN